MSAMLTSSKSSVTKLFMLAVSGLTSQMERYSTVESNSTASTGLLTLVSCIFVVERQFQTTTKATIHSSLLLTNQKLRLDW